MTEEKMALNAKYIDDHINDMAWLKSGENTHQFEGLIKNLLEEARSRIGDNHLESISFPVNVEVKPYIFGVCVEVYVNGFKVGHA